MAVVDDVKKLLGIEECDPGLDARLSIIIRHKEQQLLSYLPQGTAKVPPELEHIVCELAIARFNRIGNEGMSSFSQEGESITYESNEINPYLDEIDAWNKRQAGNKKGVLRFL